MFAADRGGDLGVLSASFFDDTIAWYEQLKLADPLDPDSDGDGLLGASRLEPFDADRAWIFAPPGSAIQL